MGWVTTTAWGWKIGAVHIVQTIKKISYAVYAKETIMMMKKISSA